LQDYNLYRTEMDTPDPSEKLDSPASDDLRTSEIRYRRLFESARDGILILDFKTCEITDVNPFMTELLGYSREEFLGKELWEIGLLKDEKESIDAFKQLKKNNYIRYDNMPLETKDGKCREVEFVSNVYSENDHDVIQCNIRDITERKNAQRSASNLAAIVESSDDAIISKNFDGTILSWNRSAEKIFGHTAKEIIGQNISILFPPERFADDEENELKKKLQRGERIHNFETIRLKKDGSRIPVSLSDWPIKNSDSEIIAISKIAHDLTRRKRTEASLRASEERFGQLVEASIIGIIITNLNGIVVEANSVFLKMVGRTAGGKSALGPNDSAGI